MHTTHQSSGFGIARLWVFVALIGSVEIAWCQTPSAVGPVTAPSLPQSVTVLRSGQVLKGQAARRGDEWVITVPEGEIRIRSSEVECCCGTIEEAYMRLRAAGGQGSVYEHLRLSQWCIRQHLLPQAEQELADAATLDPKHPMIGMLHRRIELVRSPPAEVALTSATTTDVSGADLDRLARGLPPGALESFVRWVQPLVVNNCSTAGCHGALTDSTFRLSRFSPNEPPSRSVTLRNFHAVLQCVDHDNPAASRLLVVPLRPHGTAKAAIFANPNAGPYARMVEWVYRVTNQPYSGAMTAVRATTNQDDAFGRNKPAGLLPSGMAAGTLGDDSSRATGASSALPSTATRHTGAVKRGTHKGHSSAAARDLDGNPLAKRLTDGKSLSPAKSNPDDQDNPPADGHKSGESAADPSGADSAPQRTGVQRGARTTASPPADPFDPEVFNRRFGDQSR